MNWSEAQNYCSSRGGLPSPRALVLAALSEGGRDLSFSQTAQPGYHPIYNNRNSDQQNVIGGYIMRTYNFHPPRGEFGRYSFWSSSGFPGFSYGAYGFNGNDGYIHYDDRDLRVAVRCAR